MTAMARRQLLSILVLVILGAGVAHVLKSNRPIGRNVASYSAVAGILEGRGSPVTVQGTGNLTIVLFTDYQCAACRRASPQLSRAIARDGNIRVVYKDWPIFGERSERAAAVALAANRQGIYVSVHHQLMNSSALDDDALRNAVEDAGGDWGQLEVDLRTHGSEIAGHLTANRIDALTLGLQGTPGYLIGPLLIEGALTDAEFVRAFARARAEQ